MTRPLRILSLTHTYPRFAGDTNGPFVEFLMEELAARGHQVRLLTAWDPEFELQRPERRVDVRCYRYAPRESWHVLGYSRTIRADVSLKAGMLALAPLMITAGTRRLRQEVSDFRPDLLHAHWFLPNGYMAAKVARDSGLPLLATLHGSDVFVAEKGFPYSHMSRVTNSTLGRLTSCSPELRDRICRLGFPRERSHVIPYAADPRMVGLHVDPMEARALRRKHGLEAAQPLLFALGRLVYKKGYEYLLRAMPRILEALPEARLVIGGEGDLEDELKGLCRELGIEQRVQFIGRLLRDAIPAWLAACDLFVMPSIKDRAGNIDGLPNVILEAMAMGRAVVASGVAGIPLAVREGQNGLCVPQKDAPALAAAVIRACEDPERLRRWGAESRALIDSELNWPTVASRYEQVYKNLLADHAETSS